MVLGAEPLARNTAQGRAATFAGYGVDLRVQLPGEGAADAIDTTPTPTPRPDGPLPLPLAVGAWLLAKADGPARPRAGAATPTVRSRRP